MQNHRRQQAVPSAHSTRYTPLPYAGSGTEVVDDLAAGVVPVSRLLEVAAWHSVRRGKRHSAIATKLRAIAANDNRPA